MRKLQLGTSQDTPGQTTPTSPGERLVGGTSNGEPRTLYPHPTPLGAATRISPCSSLQGQSVGAHSQAELSVSHQTEHGPTQLHPRGPRGIQPPTGTMWGGGLCCAGAGETVWGTLLSLPWLCGAAPTAASQQSSASGQGTPQSPPAWGFVLSPFPHSFPPSTPGLALSHTPNPSMFMDNFPNGCFYFIACNKGKRPKVIGSALH